MTWTHADANDRREWFACHGDEIAAAHAAFKAAALAYASVVAGTGACERSVRADQLFAQFMDTPDGVLAEEVQSWLGV